MMKTEFADKVEEMLALCRERLGLDVRVGRADAGPREQAKLWCWSRPVELVELWKCQLSGAGAPMLASLLRTDKACRGPRVTGNLPGNSFHQWGEAADVCVVIGGKLAYWGGSAMRKVIEARDRVGLHGDGVGANTGHVQLSDKMSPMDDREFVSSWADVETAMLKKWPEDFKGSTL